MNEVRCSFHLNREKTTTDFSEDQDDLLDSALINNKFNSALKNDTDNSQTEMISLKEFKDINLNKKHIHSDDLADSSSGKHHHLDHLEHQHNVSLRHHRRSSSLKSSSIKENENEIKNQSKLLNSTNDLFNFNSIILKLSFFKSILRIDLEGYVCV